MKYFEMNIFMSSDEIILYSTDYITTYCIDRGTIVIHILFVDDEPGFLAISRMFLEEEPDLRVETCESAAMAIELMRKTSFDAIVSDYDMPKMDGIELLKTVRKTGSDIPFLLLTGRGREEVVIEALNNGADFYLQKMPYPEVLYAELLHKIRHAVKRRRADMELRESEERYRSVVEFSPDAIFLQREGVITYANPAAVKVFGVTSPEDLVGKRSADMIRPEYRESLSERISELQETGHAPPGQLKIERLNGGSADVEATGSLIYKNGVAFDQVVLRDITDRKRAESELLALKERLEAEIRDLNILRSLSIRYIKGEDFGSLLYEILEAAIALTGADKGNLQLLDPSTGKLQIVAHRHFGLPFLKFFEYVDVHEATACGAAMAGMQRVIVEDITNSPVFGTGAELDAMLDEGLRAVQSTPLVSRNGPLLGVISTHFCGIHVPAERELQLLDILARQAADIIERKQAEEMMRESEERYRSLFESSRDAILITDMDGRFTDANRELLDMLGYSLDELRSLTYKEITPAVWHAREEAILQEQILPLGHSDLYEKEYIRRDGTVVPIEIRVWLMEEPAGRFSGMWAIVRDITERKQNEEALRKSEERYRRFFEEDLTGDLITSTDGRILACNPAFVSIFGFESIEEAVSSNITETYSCPDDRVQFLAFVRKEGKLENYCRVRKRRDGSLINVVENVVGQFDENGDLQEIWGYLYDDSDRKLAEDELKKSEETLRAFINGLTESALVLDTNGTVLAANDVAVRRFKTTRDVFIGSTVYDFLPPGIAAIRRKHAEIAIRDNRVVQYEDCLNGRTIEHQIAPIPDESGHVAQLALLCTDITERRSAEQFVRESRERLHLAIEAAHQGVWDKNLLTGEVVTDGHWPHLLGYSPADPIPAWKDEVHPDDRRRVQSIIRDNIEGRIPYAEVEYRMKRKDGRYTWMLTRGKVVSWDETGRPLRILGIDQDITALHTYREALGAANKKLKLLSGITRHDILNQIMALKGFLALLAKKIPDDPGTEQLLAQLALVARTMHRHITFTRDYEHMGVQEPEWQRVDRLILQASEGVRLNGARLTVATGPLEIFADPMLEKAFFNLLDNAVVHGEGVTEIRVSQYDTAGGSKMIVVEDDGVGVPASMKSTIFEKGVGKITGYGLFLVKEILDITALGITEAGEQGTGARFEIAVPEGKWRVPEDLQPV
jgi:PAS domain S-box-containing protein